jgi:hypothetical protein
VAIEIVLPPPAAPPGRATGYSVPTPSPSLNAAGLFGRPLRLPTLGPDARCEVSPRAAIHPGGKWPGYGFGTGPAYLSGQLRWFAGEAAVLLTDPAYAGPLLVRGGQLDGPGGLPLETSQDSVLFGPSAGPGSWGVWLGRIQRTAGPGCYALQVDGTSFTEEIVFEVEAGPPPPG